MMYSEILALWGKCMRKKPPQDKVRLSYVKATQSAHPRGGRLTYFNQPAHATPLRICGEGYMRVVDLQRIEGARMDRE
jgi:hypothetical protein